MTRSCAKPSCAYRYVRTTASGLRVDRQPSPHARSVTLKKRREVSLRHLLFLPSTDQAPTGEQVSVVHQMVLKPNFPLPKGYFGDARLSEEQERAFRDVVRKRLTSALRDEEEFVYANQRQVDASQWRLVKKKHQLRIFRRRRVLNSVTSDEDTWRPSMLSVGRMEGTLEDVLYGAYDKSDEELKTTIAFADVATKDCAVLHTLALAKPDDPFHYIGMKWFLTQLPASIIVKPRDWCYMEAMGIEKDASAAGRFGYIILHSVDLKSCPPFDRRAVVRGRTQLSFIFREPVPGIVEVFSQGLFDPAGELIQRFTTVMTSEVLAGVFKMAQCAEAKKLTLLALRNEADRTKAAMAMTSSSTSNGSTSNSNSNSNSTSRPEKTCHLCKGMGRMFSSLKHCRVCDVMVCSQCRVKKSIFVGPAHSVIKVNCCRTCLTHAQSMEIRPAEPEFSILGEQHLAPDQVSNIESSSGTPDDGEPTPRQNFQSTRELTAGGYGDDYGDNDDDQLSELDVNGYRFSNESGISEDDVEKLIASMIQQRTLASSGVAGGNSNGEMTRTGDEAGGADENRPVAATTVPVSYDRVPLVVQVLSGGPVPRETGKETQQATDDAMSNNSTASNSSSSNGQGAGSEPVPSSDGDSSSAAAAAMTSEQAAIFEKILLLQSAANEVYSITQANNEMMRSLTDASSVAP